MINLYYSEAYWGHSATMNGPHKVNKVKKGKRSSLVLWCKK